jgi:hypothetical protein
VIADFRDRAHHGFVGEQRSTPEKEKGTKKMTRMILASLMVVGAAMAQTTSAPAAPAAPATKSPAKSNVKRHKKAQKPAATPSAAQTTASKSSK